MYNNTYKIILLNLRHLYFSISGLLNYCVKKMFFFPRLHLFVKF